MKIESTFISRVDNNILNVPLCHCWWVCTIIAFSHFCRCKRCARFFEPRWEQKHETTRRDFQINCRKKTALAKTLLVWLKNYSLRKQIIIIFCSELRSQSWWNHNIRNITMVQDPRVTTLLSRLGGLYRDPNRVDRDASSLLKSSVGIHLIPGISPLVENNGNSSHCLVLQGTIGIVFRGTTYQLLVDIYLPSGYPIRPPVSFVRLAKNQVSYLMAWEWGEITSIAFLFWWLIRASGNFLISSDFKLT